jgi:hypothetical protein|tara:strand:- start:1876 stop:2370 length:495 start_codon:yes stop_codon:yes gene_type:complete
MSKVKNNFLKKEDFNKIKEALTSNIFPWYLNNNKTSKDPKKYTKHKNDYQLTHTFFEDDKINSNAYSLLEPIIEILKPKYFIRIKANLVSNTDKVYKFDKHTDQEYKCKAAILYINTNNGLTLFKDRKVQAKENSIVFFEGNETHQATTCTDQKYKIVINFNYQ